MAEPLYAYDVEEQLQERLAANLAHVRHRIAEAAARVGRQPEEITLVAVSKTFPVEFVKVAYNLGVTDFGENRVQEALPKIAAFHPSGLRWHMVGRLQSNKAKKVAEAFDWIESLESWHSAQALSRHAGALGRRLPVLLEVNVAGEASKGGVSPEALPDFARQVAALPQLEVQGLMTVAPLVSNAEEVRPVFRTLRELLERLRSLLPQCPWQHLSMGMTDDYWVAIEEGATIVRLGRAIFGERSRQ
ncbi:YggS family pyridoxal phosphate-dependent enzyme [Thermogemmatispora sp.]|uniref:YggS family pyridoxal phosphate-dependent enzyme n=1 Tax=Thermogemmatispora sp. TaxID=1968838 RepID=UPI001DBF6A7D|nr:YggS family pyridoxal phosphate-dependent enzyme [Thermogemmatispora sp.]MBX5451394.1 YggS family pyridoxal phosphate-dependent enzyme [Thermogemmatispora sp.]